MSIADYFTIIISLFSLIVSSIALYFTEFRKPDIHMNLGPEIHMYHPENGGTAFYLPIIFINRSPKKGFISELYLKVRTPSHDYFHILWTEEASFKIREWDYTHIDNAKPFIIEGNQTVSKICWFNWPNNPEKELLFAEGAYEFTIVASTGRGIEELLRQSETLIISKELSSIMIERYKTKDPTTRFVNFKNKSLIAIYSGKDDVNLFSKTV